MQRRRLVIATVGVVVATSALTAGGVAARDAMYVDDPLPGVSVAEVDLDGTLNIAVGGRALEVETAGVFEVDGPATAGLAYAAGRDSFWSRMRQLALPVPPAIGIEPVLRATERLEELAAELEDAAELQQPRRARLALRGAEPVVTAARPGRVIDRERFAAALEAALRAGEGELVAPLRESRPDLDTEAAEEAAATVRRVLRAPVRLSFRGQQVGELGPDRLARLLRIGARGSHFVVTFDRERVAKAVQPALDPWRKRAQNARFAVDGDSVRIVPSRPGLDVNPKVALEAVTAAAYSDVRVAELALRETRAELTTARAEALGIRERISSFTTDMGTSSANRIHNVHLMANYIDGTVIRPGEEFSFNERVGPRTVERGFREGQMIIGSLLLPSIGGGVCQTATTLFNNAWELGLPILKRQNHSFYISHYPLGRDAAVSWGGPDFVFRNDLKTGILITARYTNDTLTFDFWGTHPKRRIVTTEGPKTNWRSPETTYAFDPYAPRGSVRTVSGSNQSGFDVTVSRKVFEGQRLVREDSVTSNYIAVGPTRIYGPGSAIPGPYFVLPRV
ncbi:MAG TPA: VanW family protein [Gaiellaceae bacterium]|nr:VanW family protein [Gaiellaceae bacterium]